MPDLDPRRLAVPALALLAVLALGAWYLARADGAAGDGAAPPAIRVSEDGGADQGDDARVVVHVAGAVRAPGVYRLAASARVDEAVERAGGATRRADLDQVNLAATVEDGRQVLVPRRPPAGGGGAAVGGAPAAPAPGVPLNLNVATVDQLEELDGIGPATAQQIVDYRDANDGFSSVDELDQVPGIGEVRLAALRDQVRV